MQSWCFCGTLTLMQCLVSEYGHFNRITGDAEESIPFNVLFTGEGSLKLGGCDYWLFSLSITFSITCFNSFVIVLSIKCLHIAIH